MERTDGGRVESAAQGRDDQAHKLAARAGEVIHRAEARVRGVGHRMERTMEKPVMGAVVAGGAVLAAAVIWGAAEAAVAAMAAYGVYRIIRRARGLEPPPPVHHPAREHEV